MKTLLYKIGAQAAMTFVMLLLVFAPFQTLIAEAGLVSCNPDGSGPAGCIVAGPTSAAPAAQATNPVTNATGNIDTGTAATVGTAVAKGDNSGTGASTQNNAAPSSDIFGNCGVSNISACVSALIYAFTIGIGSVFAYIAAYFFDITIQLSLNGASYGLDFISTSWTTARDLGNMAFLFILLYIAFTIILKADTGQTKTMLATVILIALLVNFSFFFSRVVIDAGNILSIQFYNAIPAPPISQTIQGSSIQATVANYSSSIGGTAGGTKDLTAGVMNMLNVQGLLNNKSFDSTKGNFIATVFIYIAGAIVLWLLTIAFVTNGIKFLYRVVVLWFLIIVSPLALIAIAIEGSGGNFKKWREALIQHSFYPVAFMFIFLVLNNFAVTMANNTSLTGGVFTTAQSGSSSSFSAIGASLVALAIRLILVIAVLYIGMQQSDKISVAGSKYAEKAGSWAGGMYKNTYSWAGGAAYRNTGGRAAAAIDDKVKNSRWANKAGSLGGVLGYRLRKNVLAPAKATSLGTVASSYDERQKYLKERKATMGDNTRARDNADAIKEATEKIVAGTPLAPKEKNTIQRISKKEFETMRAADIKAIASALTEDQIKKIGDLEKMPEKDREEIKAQWEEKSEESPYSKSLKKLRALTDGTATASADASAAMARHKRTVGSSIDSGFATTLKTILQDDHRVSSIDYTAKEGDFRDASRALRPVKAAHDAAVAADAAAPTAATAAAVAAAATALAPHAATHAAAQAAMNAAHAARQATQDRLDSFKEFDDSRKKVEPNETLNDNGVKGTYKSSLV